ncbi:hypothetical protein CKO10_01790 [Rhodospirillum rubrum]|uniref:hypothetical protein n=1 Tax=Rhodospirillum rubrum TaxID=1085 RepID=UPI001904FFC0|nr:hypothetical protein [Rhodospirillum rubrum]MBK1663242.1 hypothetical protein [Rhodospirillum rubrum]
MAVDATVSAAPTPAKDQATPGYRIEGDKVINDNFLDGFTFWDALDVINPLQHIPIVGPIYRELTGDELKSGPRLAGGTLFGGVLGLVDAAVNVAVQKMTGKDIGGHVIAMAKSAAGYDEEPVLTAKVAAPSGTAAALDPHAPISLLPPKWQATANAASTAGAGTGAGGPAAKNMPLGYDALTPAGAASGATGAGSGKAKPGKVDLILPQQKADRTSGSEPQGLPLGYDALAAAPAKTSAVPSAQVAKLQTQIGDAKAALARTIAAQEGGQLGTIGQQGSQQSASARRPGPTSLTQQEGLQRTFSGKTLAQYQAQAPGVVTARMPTTLTGPRVGSVQTVAPGRSPREMTDPATMAGLLDMQAEANRLPKTSNGLSQGGDSGATDVGDTLSIPEKGRPTASATPPNGLTTSPGVASSAGAAPAAAVTGDQTSPWFNQQMMRGLEKYQKSRGGLPTSGTDINA